MTWSFGISPAWTRPCRLSDRSSPVSGEFTSEKHRISTQLLNMWRISFIQTSSTLAAFMFAKVYTNSAHTHLLCFIEPHVNSVASSSFHSKRAFPKQMAELCECLCVFILCFTGFINRDQILFFGCGNQWGELEGLRLLTETDATFNVVRGWPDSMLEWQTSWASERKLAWS